MKILLIIPCYNEETRLRVKDFEDGIENLKKQQIDLHYLFANDGSSDSTKKILDQYCIGDNKSAFHAPENVGKANVIHLAFQSFKSQIKLHNYDWIGYWDSDLATPIFEVANMIKYLDFYKDQKVEAIWGSRISRLGSKITRQMHRHYLGRIFVTIVSNVLGVKVYDSQCGAKLFTAKSAEIALSDTFLSRWIFDVEILLRLKETHVIEYPLMTWEDIPGSKVKVFKEAFRVLKDLYKIKQKYQ